MADQKIIADLRQQMKAQSDELQKSSGEQLAGARSKGARRLMQMGIAQVQVQVAGRKAQEAAEEAAKMQQAGVCAQRQWKEDLDKLRAQLQAVEVAANDEVSEVTTLLSAAQSALETLEQKRADEHTQALLDKLQQVRQAEQRVDEAEQRANSLEEQLARKSSQIQKLETELVDAKQTIKNGCIKMQSLCGQRDLEADENIARVKMMDLQISELEKQLQDNEHAMAEITADRDKLGFLFELQTGKSWKASMEAYIKVCVCSCLLIPLDSNMFARFSGLLNDG